MLNKTLSLFLQMNIQQPASRMSIIYSVFFNFYNKMSSDQMNEKNLKINQLSANFKLFLKML